MPLNSLPEGWKIFYISIVKWSTGMHLSSVVRLIPAVFTDTFLLRAGIFFGNIRFKGEAVEH